MAARRSRNVKMTKDPLYMRETGLREAPAGELAIARSLAGALVTGIFAGFGVKKMGTGCDPDLA